MNVTIPGGSEQSEGHAAEKFTERPGVPPCALVVDDNDGVRACCRVSLERVGWRVDAVSDGNEALDILLSSANPPEYDLILSDFRMPIVNGIEFYDILSAKRPELTPGFVLMSASLNEAPLSVFLKRIAVATLAKPFSHDALLQAAECARRASSGR